MIALFIGDSFTWGQGLQYYPLMQNKGWSMADCDNFYKSRPIQRFESLGFEVDEFRKQNGFPALVSKQIDLPFNLLTFENGGDNHRIYTTLKNILPYSMTPNNVSLMVIQFSSPVRSILQNLEVKKETIDEQIVNQIVRIATYLNGLKINWLALSWEETLGSLLKELYPDNHIPILYEGNTYDNFGTILGELSIAKETNKQITDNHFSMYGHKVIANSIISKIYSRKDLVHHLNLGGTYD
jgi:lysophospholipase L1-like esterase